MAKLGAYRGRLLVDFRFRGIRRREYLRLSDTAANRTRAQAFLKLLEGEPGNLRLRPALSGEPLGAGPPPAAPGAPAALRPLRPRVA